MNNDLKNYSTQPDPEVWEKIEKTLHRRSLLRRIAAVATGAMAVAAVIVVIAVNRNTITETASTPTQSLPDVAMTTPAATPAQPAVAEPEAMPAPSPAPAVAPKPIPQQKSISVPATNTPAPDTMKATTSVLPITQQATAVKPTSTAKVENTTTAIKAPAPTTSTVADNNEKNVLKPIEPIATAEPPRNEVKSSYNSPLDDTILWIPNAFAPNADDPDIRTFHVVLNHASNSISNYRIVIFNRGGQQVFYSDNINQHWDGSFKGRPLPQSAYIYIINYTDSDQVRHQRKGTVTLIR